VASLSQGRTAAAQCGLFTYKSVPVIFEPSCTKRKYSWYNRSVRISLSASPASLRTPRQTAVTRVDIRAKIQAGQLSDTIYKCHCLGHLVSPANSTTWHTQSVTSKCTEESPSSETKSCSPAQRIPQHFIKPRSSLPCSQQREHLTLS